MDESRLSEELLSPPMARLYCFNGGNEHALCHADKASFTHSRLVQQMRCDLSLLLAWVAENPTEDKIWLPRGSSKEVPEYADMIAPCGCVWEDDLPHKLPLSSPLTLSLWAPEPSLMRSFARMVPSFNGRLLLPEAHSYPSYLFDRSQVGTLLDFMGEEYAALSPRGCTSSVEIDRALYSLQSRERVVVKLPFSSSGRGVLLFELPLTQQKRQQLYSFLNTNERISIEPFWDKCADYAAEYKVAPDGDVHFVGLSHFETKDFRYLYNHVQPPDVLWSGLAQRVGEQHLVQVIDRHKEFITRFIAPHYRGVVGIDMFTYREGRARKELLHPAVEINVRSTMGFLAHQLYERYGAEQRSYRMHIKSYPREGLAWADFQQQKLLNPLKSSNRGTLLEGTFSLTYPTEKSRFWAYLTSV